MKLSELTKEYKETLTTYIKEILIRVGVLTIGILSVILAVILNYWWLCIIGTIIGFISLKSIAYLVYNIFVIHRTYKFIINIVKDVEENNK